MRFFFFSTRAIMYTGWSKWCVLIWCTLLLQKRMTWWNHHERRKWHLLSKLIVIRNLLWRSIEEEWIHLVQTWPMHREIWGVNLRSRCSSEIQGIQTWPCSMKILGEFSCIKRISTEICASCCIILFFDAWWISISSIRRRCLSTWQEPTRKTAAATPKIRISS